MMMESRLKERLAQLQVKFNQQLSQLEPEFFMQGTGDLFVVLEGLRVEVRQSLVESDKLLSELETLATSGADSLQPYLEQQKALWQQQRLKFRQKNLKLTKELEVRYYEKQRESLLGDRDKSTLRNRMGGNKTISYSADAAVKSAEKVTSDLQRMTQMMTMAVERSGETVRAMDDSSRTLQRTHRQYQNITDLMVTTRGLLSRLWQRDFIDRYFIGFAFCVYLLVVLYIISKRIWIPSIFLWIWRSLMNIVSAIFSIVFGSATPESDVPNNIETLISATSSSSLTSLSTPSNIVAIKAEL
jgi:hypothetical protein